MSEQHIGGSIAICKLVGGGMATVYLTQNRCMGEFSAIQIDEAVLISLPPHPDIRCSLEEGPS